MAAQLGCDGGLRLSLRQHLAVEDEKGGVWVAQGLLGLHGCGLGWWQRTERVLSGLAGLCDSEPAMIQSDGPAAHFANCLRIACNSRRRAALTTG